MTGQDERPEGRIEVVIEVGADGGRGGDRGAALRYAAATAGDPTIAVAPAVLQRFRARILDPATAARTADTRRLLSTVYVGDTLLVTHPQVLEPLAEAARLHGLRLVEDPDRVEQRRRCLELAARAGLENADRLFPYLVTLVPLGGRAVAPDAWAVLQSLRAHVGAHSPLVAHAALDHLLTATMHVQPVPFDDGAPGAAPASASYGQPGWGGRQPVNWLGGPPARRAELPFRRPVVAVLDTGVARHRWFDAPDIACVERNAELFGVRLGLPEPGGSEHSGVVSDPLEGVLDPYSGHGTFIAGLVRQQAPDADILSVRVMPSEGAVAEHTLLQALSLLACRQAIAQESRTAPDIVDVVSLSLGYYHEQADDALFDPLLRAPLEALAQRVAVVASAGNDATTRPMFPAALTVFPLDGPAWVGVPISGVGALNPDGSTALFSNAGPWVTCEEPGAGLVSTFPPFDASRQAGVSFDHDGERRASIDQDNFTAGFGVWSGTSFAAPVLAGKIAQSLVDGAATDDPDRATSVERTSGALATAVARGSR